MARYRMIGRWGTGNCRNDKYNVLQRRVLWWWVDMEIEHVPAWAWIQASTLGSTDWISSLHVRYRALTAPPYRCVPEPCPVPGRAPRY